MHVLQNTMKQRKEWRILYNLDDKELFEAFSEFSSMMLLNRQKINDENPISLKQRTKDVNKDYLHDVFPITTSSRKYNQMRKEEEHLQYKLKKQDLVDFRVPSYICMEFSEVLKSTKAKLRPTVMRALGIWSSSKEDKMSYEQFLNMCSLLKFKRGDKEKMIDFTVRLFDPVMAGFTPN